MCDQKVYFINQISYQVVLTLVSLPFPPPAQDSHYPPSTAQEYLCSLWIKLPPCKWAVLMLHEMQGLHTGCSARGRGVDTAAKEVEGGSWVGSIHPPVKDPGTGWQALPLAPTQLSTVISNST